MSRKDTACNDSDIDKIMKIYMEALVYLQNDDYMLKSQEYLEIDNKLEEQKACIKEKAKGIRFEDKIEKLLNSYDDTWQSMNFIYRTYGFLDGLMIGLILNKQSNEEFYQKLYMMVKNRW
ncbi:hypothetical protein [Massilicoli timonensis]|uniref:hypothetical protein n=1 Tax=Massilicoli timonensis TaxID=2015901 RepID=UPI000C82E010|nr:hypothetical protein [Massilicoli timonensis]